MRAVACLLIAVFASSIGWALDSPFDVGSAAQLFTDQTLVRSSERVTFTLHPAEKHQANPIIKADRPWEGWRIGLYGNVLYEPDEKLFKMWYVSDTTPDFPDFATLYATSTDGITWTKPILGVVKSATGSTENNAVLKDALLASVMKDERETDPQRRYKMVCWIHRPKPEGGPHTFTSPDGIRWTRRSTEPICKSNDVITAYRDEARGLYVAFPKLSTPVRGGPVRRCFGLTTSADFLKWKEPRYVFVPDQRDDAGSLARIEEVRAQLDVPDDPKLMRTEFYGLGVYVAESCTLAFPWVFTINNNARFGNHEGPSEVQLAATRDLENWDRSFRTPILPQGKPGEWDSGFLSTQSRALRVGDEVWLYYAGANYTHGTPCLYKEEGTGRGTKYTNSIGLAKWKLDRFVSADAGPDGGTLTTVPMLFRGTRLELNAATNGDGHITVEVLDPKGTVLAQTKPVTGDDLRHRVEWMSDLRLAQFASQPVALRFHLKNAQLFSFAFRD